MAKRAAKKVPRHGAARNARRGTRAFCRVCRGPHTKRQHWSHKKGERTTSTRKTTSYKPRRYAKAPAGYKPWYDRVARPQAGRSAGRSLAGRKRKAALPAAPVKRSKQLAAKSAAARKRGGTKRGKLTAGQKRYRARMRAQSKASAERLNAVGFAAFAGAARAGKARRRALEAAEARGAAKAAGAAVKASKKERRQARKAGAVSGLPRTPWDNTARKAAKRGGRKGGRKGRKAVSGAPRTPWSR